MYGHEIADSQLAISEYFKSYMDMLTEYRAARADEIEEMLRMYYDAESGYSPDLDSLPQLDMYLLRYATANFFEYMIMYDLAIQKLRNKDHLAVASLGCGSKIDALSLAFAAQYYGMTPESLLYFGVDSVDWKRKFVVSRDYIANMRFMQEGMEQFFAEDIPYYKLCKIFVFAKVLSEDFDTAALENEIENAMRDYPYDEVVVSFSLRSRNCTTDLDISDRIIAAFISGMGGIENCVVDCTYSDEGTASQRKIRAALEYMDRSYVMDGTELRTDPIVFNSDVPEAYENLAAKPYYLVHPLFRKTASVDGYFRNLRDAGYVSPNGDALYPSANVDPMCLRIIHIRKRLPYENEDLPF